MPRHIAQEYHQNTRSTVKVHNAYKVCLPFVCPDIPCCPSSPVPPPLSLLFRLISINLSSYNSQYYFHRSRLITKSKWPRHRNTIPIHPSLFSMVRTGGGCKPDPASQQLQAKRYQTVKRPKRYMTGALCMDALGTARRQCLGFHRVSFVRSLARSLDCK